MSKEPDHLLTGQTNGKSTLSDKLPGTMTVRSVLLNRDSPDIESRLRRRRNRTHQVRFKDLEDGSSSSGNSGTGENNSHQKPATDCDSPHPHRKHSSRSPQPWSESDRLRAGGLPGQTSVVGAVRGDMASTIEVVAAFLARAPPHPLTPGPTRRCWAPPQINSLTLPMTRRASTSTAIQTSPCLKKPQSFSSAHTRSHSLGDSMGVEGDDEHDSQDEYLTHNNVLSKDHNGPPSRLGDGSAVERRSKTSRTDMKSAVCTTKNSRHSCPSSVLHNTEPCHYNSISSRDIPKRPGSSTPSVARRRKRLNRTTSDPGKEVHYCTTVTQTESTTPPSQQPPVSKLCTTQVQTDSHSTPYKSKYCTTQSQTESPHGSSSSTSKKQCTTPTKIANCSPTKLPNVEPTSTPEIQTDISCHSSPSHHPCTIPTQTCSPCPSPPLITQSCSVQVQLLQNSEYQPETKDPLDTQTTTVPYCSSPQPTPISEHISTPPSSSPAKTICSNQNSPIAASMMSPTSLSTTVKLPASECCIVSPTTTTRTVVISSSSSSAALPCSTPDVSSAMPYTASISTVACAISTSAIIPSVQSSRSPIHQTSATDIADQPPHNASKAASETDPVQCTFTAQTTLSCTSISYYSTTQTIGPTAPLAANSSSSSPPYTTLIQTVSHCNIPCHALQNTSAANKGITPYSSPVPKLKSCTSPPPLVKTYAPALLNTQASATPTKAVPLYSSTFRAAPPYTPPSQALQNAQDKRGIRLPPPPPPPPPYTPRKTENDPPGTAIRTPKLRADCKASKKDKDVDEKKEDKKCPGSPKPFERASSLKHRAQTPPVAVIKGEKQSSSSPAKACFKPGCLSSAQAQLGVLHKMLCSGASARPNTPNSQNPQGCSSARGCLASGEQPTAGPLTASQSDTIRQVQEILGGLMSGARCKLDPARVTEKLLGPNGPLHDIRSLQTQLQSLEGVLETSQNTIKVLLDVIQDLEKKEAERDG